MPWSVCLKEKKDRAYACKTCIFNGVTSICALWTVKEKKANTSLQGEHPPRDSPPGVCAWPLRPCLAAWGTSRHWADNLNFIHLLGPKPVSGLLWYPWGAYQFYGALPMRSEQILQESKLRRFLGGGVGSFSISEKTKHFEKNGECAVSN